MDKDKITAEWARKRAEEVLDNKIKKELVLCLSKIEEAVEKGSDMTTIYAEVDFLTSEELEKRGFKLKGESNFRDGGSLTISW